MFVLGFGVMVGLVGFPLVTRNLGAPLCRLPAKAEEEQSLATGAPLAERFEIPTGTEVLGSTSSVLLNTCLPYVHFFSSHGGSKWLGRRSKIFW